MTVYRLLQSLRPAHNVTLVSLTDGSESADAESTIRRLGVEVHTVHLPRWRSWVQAWIGLLSTNPSQVSFYRSRRMSQLIQEVAGGETFDAIVVHMIRMTPFVSSIEHPVKILLLGDSMSLALRRAMVFAPLWRRLGMQWEAVRLAKLERKAACAARETWLFSEVDRADFVARGCPNVITVPLSVDLSLLTLPIGPRPAAMAMFLGNLSVPHNIDGAVRLADEIWPLVRERVPDARLAIVGADPVPSVVALGRRPGIEVTGMVPDLAPLWRTASVLIAPLRFATGVQTKVLEAMAAGVPVVTTPIVADGIGARHESEMLVGQSAADLADRVVELLSGGGKSMDLATRARRFVSERYTWSSALARMERIAADARGCAGVTLRA